MSYSVDLWSSYNKVEKRLELNFKGLKEFIKIISEYHSAIYSYSSNLKKIYDIECKTQNESLQIGIKGFKSDILNQIHSLNEFLTSIKDDIITPLIKLREDILDKIRKNLEETSKTEKAYHNCVLNLESLKKDFNNSVEDIENNKLKYEISKKKNFYENKNNILEDYNVIESNEIKIISGIKNAKEKEKKYINYIKDTNIMQEEYIEIKKKNLNNFQKIEEELGLNIKDSLRKYVIFKISYLRNLQYDLDKKAKLMENINIRNDIFDYIIKNSTNAIPPEKCAYHPYKCEIGKNNNNSLNKDIINEVKNFITTAFSLKSAKDIMDIKSNNLINIENLVNFAFFSEKNFGYDEKKILKNFSVLKRSRRYLLDSVNKIRIKNKLILDEFSYNNISEILKECVINLDKEKDYESYKLIILISNTMYKIDGNNIKIFLNKSIIDFPIWKKINFWKNMIQYEIIEEMAKQKKINLFKKESKENKLKKIQSISISYINAYLYNMISFNLDAKLMYDIIIYFSEYYFLEKKEIDSFNNITKNYKKGELIEKKNEKFFSEEKNIIINNNIIKIKNINYNTKTEINNTQTQIQKQPLDNIFKAKKRKEYITSSYNITNKDNFENLNINLINNDNNLQEENKKINNDDYKEEDIKSQIAPTEHSYDKSESLDITIKESSNLKIINEDNK